jgi:hypothetical protein
MARPTWPPARSPKIRRMRDNDLAGFLARLVERGPGIRAVWSLGNPDDAAQPSGRELLAFADRPTLERLRAAEDLHRADVQLLVVVDGDRFENAWGPCRLSGSLARWAWRQVSPAVAYYDESKWAQRHGEAGTVVRVRRKALLVWQPQLALQ